MSTTGKMPTAGFDVDHDAALRLSRERVAVPRLSRERVEKKNIAWLLGCPAFHGGGKFPNGYDLLTICSIHPVCPFISQRPGHCAQCPAAR